MRAQVLVSSQLSEWVAAIGGWLAIEGVFTGLGGRSGYVRCSRSST